MVDQGEKRCALMVLAFLSTCHNERLDALQDQLCLPMAMLTPCLQALKEAGYIRFSFGAADKFQISVHITPLGQAYFVETTRHLRALVSLLDDEPESGTPDSPVKLVKA